MSKKTLIISEWGLLECLPLSTISFASALYILQSNLPYLKKPNTQSSHSEIITRGEGFKGVGGHADCVILQENQIVPIF